MWWRGKELWGCIEVLPTPSGLLLWDLYSRGVKVGVSSRSWASLVRTKNGACQVGDDMELITFDFVVDPSNSGAFLLPLTRRFRWVCNSRGGATEAVHRCRGGETCSCACSVHHWVVCEAASTVRGLPEAPSRTPMPPLTSLCPAGGGCQTSGARCSWRTWA